MRIVPKCDIMFNGQEKHDLIIRYYNRNIDDKIVLCDKMRKKGYTRSYAVMCQYIRRQGIEQLEKYNKRSNNIPKICLKFLSPNEALEKYYITGILSR